MATENRRNRMAYALLAFMAFCLAGNNVLGRMVHESIPPIGLSFWRWMAGALILLPFVLRRIADRRRQYIDHAGALALLGFLIAASTTLVLIALNFTTAVNVSVINAFQPVLTVLLAVVFLGERVSRLGTIGIVLAFLGVLVMIFEGDVTHLTQMALNGGDLLATVAMLGFAAYAVNIKRKLPRSLSPAEALFAIALVASLILLPFYIVETVVYKPVPPGLLTLATVFVLALLVSVLGNLAWNAGIRLIGPSRAIMFINLIPLFGSALAVIFLDELVQGYHLLGTCLICGGIWLLIRNSGE